MDCNNAYIKKLIDTCSWREINILAFAESRKFNVSYGEIASKFGMSRNNAAHYVGKLKENGVFGTVVGTANGTAIGTEGVLNISELSHTNGTVVGTPVGTESKANIAKELQVFFNAKMDKANALIPRCQKMTGKRKDMLLARTREYGIEKVKEAFSMAARSKFLNGSTGFVADITWIVRPNNFIKVLEGNYNISEDIVSLEREREFEAQSSNYSEEEIEKYKKFNDWIDRCHKDIASIKRQLTLEQFHVLFSTYEKTEVFDAIKKMDNDSGLHYNNSVYLTIIDKIEYLRKKK